MSPMQEHRPPPLDQEANRWLAHLHSGRAREQDHQDLDRWRRRSPAHEAAYQRAQTLWRHLGTLSLDGVSLDNGAEMAAPRRQRRLLPLALAAAVVLALVFLGQSPWRLWRADLRTAAGEQLSRDLADGSHLVLNGNSAANWHLDDVSRRIELLRGEALFQVAADHQRPFTVQAGDARIRVTGTRFNVAREGDDVLLTVIEGQVLASDRRHRETLNPGQAVRWKDGGLQDPVSVDAAWAEAWTRGRLIVRDLPLEEVVRRLERYQDTPIWVLGDARHRRVSGVFDTGDPAAMLTALAASLSIHQYRLPGLIILR
ncbi:FecR family protein [Alloalcanivorax xenomutans]|uniref:FecR domain-containing protein n=2 Tax=Alloalcanivorax xenomutans TaxID=1094342 RepID=A0A9Q3W395_9GAMM|nr:FecR domain-containing protein [Alloalcanivorax xenomutans]MCE7508194.1 FecR domain-containing protein [Alloalcanivorax xenomutans]WOA31087.1 FecR domain-containing protein [Alloalcanivorax xenomutans]